MTKKSPKGHLNPYKWGKKFLLKLGVTKLFRKIHDKSPRQKDSNILSYHGAPMFWLITSKLPKFLRIQAVFPPAPTHLIHVLRHWKIQGGQNSYIFKIQKIFSNYIFRYSEEKEQKELVYLILANILQHPLREKIWLGHRNPSPGGDLIKLRKTWMWEKDRGNGEKDVWENEEKLRSSV